MELVNVTKNVFQKQLMGLSPKVNELSEVVWFVFKMGGSAPVNIISSRFHDFSKDLENLVQLGVLKKMNEYAIFTEQFENRLIRKNINSIDIQDIHNTLLEKYSSQLSKLYSLDELLNPLSTVLTVVINSTSPNQPVFLSKLLRSVKDALGVDDLGKAKELLEYYLLKYLGLVQLEGSFGVNLSEKAVEVVKGNQDLWNAYNSKPKEEAVKTEPKIEPKPEEKKVVKK